MTLGKERWLLAELPKTVASLTFFDKTTDNSRRAFWNKGSMCSLEEQRTNMSYQTIPNISMHDLREKVHQLSLDDHGFQLVASPSNFTNLKDENELRHLYMNETIQLVKEATNGVSVIGYDLRYRENLSSDVRQELTAADAGSSGTPDSPGWQVHTKDGGYRHLRRYLSDEQIRFYLTKDSDWRIRIVNAWRPVSGVVGDVPLAFCDHATIDLADLVPTDRRWSGLNREIYNLKWNPDQRWYWIRDQTPDEVTLFVNWDSAPVKGGAEFCAHAAFLDPNADPTRPSRRSIEVRTLVITKEKVPVTSM